MCIELYTHVPVVWHMGRVYSMSEPTTIMVHVSMNADTAVTHRSVKMPFMKPLLGSSSWAPSGSR